MAGIRVLVVDDSAVVRQVLSQVIAQAPGLSLLAVASDPLFALERMKAEWPDVIVLDIEMPRMDGITFLRKLMAERPTPVVICSTLTQRGASTTMDALAAGAVSIISKPTLGLRGFLEGAAADLVAAIRAAAHANPARLGPLKVTPRLDASSVLSPPTHTRLVTTTERVVAIGTSTGGPQALEVVLTALPRVCPGIAIVQHMPPAFTRAFAERLDGMCEVEVREARHGDRVLPGLALIAPGGQHMMLRRSGAYYYVDVVDGPLVNRHKPSVDVLFRSVAKHAAQNALGAILTGMGDDGAVGLLEMRQAGAFTLAQDESTSVVYGMPKEAVRRDAVDRQIALDELAPEIVRFGQASPAASRARGHG